MKHIFKNKRNILMMMFSLVVIMGIGFAAYSQQLKINETSSIDSNWDVYIKSVDVKNTKGGATGNGTVDSKTAASLTTDLKYPGDNVIYNITVANDGTIDALLEKINFSMEKENTVIKYYYSVDDEATWNEVTKSSENPYDVDLLANTTDEFQVKVEYDPTKTGTATEEQKSNKLTLNLDYVQKKGGGTVPSNGATVGGQTVTLAETGEDGLYEDEYESGRYIYKGANPDNYITFNDELWKIVSVELDGGIKLIKDSRAGYFVYDPGYTASIPGVTEKNSLYGTRHTTNSTDYCYQYGGTISYAGCNVWGSKTTMLDVSGNNITKIQRTVSDMTLYDLPEEESYLNTYLNNTYYNTLNENSKNLIDVHEWNVGLIAKDTEKSLETDIEQSKKYKWKGKIGLISAIEYVRANTNKELCGTVYLNRSSSNNADTCKLTNWLNQTSDFWTMSMLSYSIPHSEVYITSNGTISGTGGNFGKSTWPALYLKPDITLSGKGTSDEPYTINS